MIKLFVIGIDSLAPSFWSNLPTISPISPGWRRLSPAIASTSVFPVDSIPPG